MRNRRLTIVLGISGLLVACTREVPPRTVSEFRKDPILLEATQVRCARNRALTKYEAECVNAREAINLIARADDEARRAELEAQSERKRRALRRTQEAAVEARRHAAEAEQLRRETEYLAQFDAVPSEQGLDEKSVLPADVQTMAIAPDSTEGVDQTAVEEEAGQVAGSDLDAIRKELARRQDQDHD